MTNTVSAGANSAPANRPAALDLPQLAAACPTCNAQPGDLCTSHGGTRIRRHDVHQARRDAWQQETGGAA